MKHYHTFQTRPQIEYYFPVSYCCHLKYLIIEIGLLELHLTGSTINWHILGQFDRMRAVFFFSSYLASRSKSWLMLSQLPENVTVFSSFPALTINLQVLQQVRLILWLVPSSSLGGGMVVVMVMGLVVGAVRWWLAPLITRQSAGQMGWLTATPAS